MLPLADERLHADTFAYKSLASRDLTSWNNCRSAHRFMAFQGKQLIIYKLFDGMPEIQNTLTCTDVKLTFKGGFSTLWEDLQGRVIELSHAPTLIQDNIFIWHVFDNNVQYYPFHGKFSVRLPLAYKMESNPMQKLNGVTYILERAVFNSMFGNTNS